MSIKDLLKLANNAAKGIDNFSDGAVGFNGFGFVFRDSHSDLPYVQTIHSSKFCQLSFTRNIKSFREKYPHIDEKKYEILLGSTLKSLVPSIKYGGDEVLYAVWLFILTPDKRQFPATFYYGPSGGALGGWHSYNGEDSRVTKDFTAIINFSPFEFTQKEIHVLVDSLENALKKVPLTDYYGIYKHDMGKTLMGVKVGKPFSVELLDNNPSEKKIERLISVLLLE